MKYGHSATPKKKMYLKNFKARLVMVTFGHGQQFALIQNLFPVGLLLIAPLILQWSLWKI